MEKSIDDSFLEDLKFIQLLLNKDYISYLIGIDFFKHKNSLNYLKYLRYFKSLPYITTLIYPDCLVWLEKLIEIIEESLVKKENFAVMEGSIRDFSLKIDNEMKALYHS